MAVRRPLFFLRQDFADSIGISAAGNNVTSQPDSTWQTQLAHVAYLYSTAPTVTVSVVSDSGTLSPTMADTRLQAGAEFTPRGTSSAPAETDTAEPSTVTVNHDKLTGPTYDTSLSESSDQGPLGYPVYFDEDEDCIKSMTHQDYVDTFIYATLDEMISSSESSLTNGTFTIAESASVTNYTEVSGSNTVIFSDTRADTSAYSAAGIPETLDQPTTITNYYLQRRSDARVDPTYNLLFLDEDGNLNEISKEDDNAFFTRVKNDIRFFAAEDTNGHKLSYNINGSGNSRGTAMVDTRLDGSGNYQTLNAGLDDYRAQEFPNGSAQTINTYTFKITHV